MILKILTLLGFAFLLIFGCYLVGHKDPMGGMMFFMAGQISILAEGIFSEKDR